MVLPAWRGRQAKPFKSLNISLLYLTGGGLLFPAAVAQEPLHVSLVDAGLIFYDLVEL